MVSVRHSSTTGNKKADSVGDGEIFDLSVARQDFLKRSFKVIFVSTRTIKGKYKQTLALTRKLTKLAPKLIRGLWFLKNIVRKQATCE